MNAEAETHYSVLGLTSVCSVDEVKRAFREKCRKSHPDKGGDEAVFKRQLEAYQVLSDAHRRRCYDYELSCKLGKKFESNRRVKTADVNSFFEFSFDDPTKAFFQGLYDVFSDGFKTRAQFSKKQDHDNIRNKFKNGTDNIDTDSRIIMEHIIMVGLEELYVCKQRKFSLKIPCPVNNCLNPHCTNNADCGYCQGIQDPQDQSASDIRIVTIRLNPGIDLKQPIEFKIGDSATASECKCILFHLREKPHDRYSRQGCNLLIQLHITLSQALWNFQYLLTHLDNRKYFLEYNNVIKPNGKCMAKGLGLPKTEEERGDLIIEFIIDFPKDADLKDKISSNDNEKRSCPLDATPVRLESV